MGHVIPTFQLKKLSFREVSCLFLSLSSTPSLLQCRPAPEYLSVCPATSPEPWAQNFTCLSLGLLTYKVGVHLTCPTHLSHSHLESQVGEEDTSTVVIS